MRQVLRKELGLKIVECEGTLEGGDVLWTGISLVFYHCIHAVTCCSYIHELNTVLYVCEYDRERVHLLKIFTVRYINMWVHKDGSSDF